MPPRLSNRSKHASQSEIRAMTIECARVKGINLAQGVCDLAVPDPVLAGARDALPSHTTYTRFDGLPDIRTAIAARMARDHGRTVDPETEIVVSIGATGAFYATCLALLEPGDEVILFEPGYGYHANTLLALDAVPVAVRLQPPDWTLDEAALRAALSPRTKAVIVNTPGNPTGKVFSRADLELLARVARERDLAVITDEIYEHFVFDGREHIPPAGLPGMAERTVTISGFSKVFAITGWRLGYAVCREDWSRAIGHLSDLVYVCAPAPLQMGAARGLLELGPDYYAGVARDHQAKRDRFCAALDKAGLTPHPPQGAYYALADISAFPGTTGRERAMHLLEKTGLACVPGGAFVSDGSGEGLGRFCFAKQWDVLEEACRRLENL